MTIEKIVQRFNPPIRINTGAKKERIKSREWYMDENAAVANNIQKMGYMGQCQIEEVWKRYRKDRNIYISNYGYVAVIEEQKAQEILGDKLTHLDGDGVRFVDFDKAQQKLIIEKNVVPKTRRGTGCKIWLYIDGIDIHVMVAEKFLGERENAWGIHHIDNNSYNNSVTNLVWVTKSEHNRRLHPMSL